MIDMDYKAGIERIISYANERELRIIYQFALSLTARKDTQEK